MKKFIITSLIPIFICTLKAENKAFENTDKTPLTSIHASENNFKEMEKSTVNIEKPSNSFNYLRIGHVSVIGASAGIGRRTRFDKNALDVSLNYAFFPVLDSSSYLSLKASYLTYSKKSWYIGGSLEGGLALLRAKRSSFPTHLPLNGILPIPNAEILVGKESYNPSRSSRTKFIQMGISLTPLIAGIIAGEGVLYGITLPLILFSYGISF
jgi:hypothetical protein